MPYEPLLHARPTPVGAHGATGLQPLKRGGQRDSYLYVPPQYDPQDPPPLALLLHGAGGHAHQALELLQRLAEDRGLILVAPASNGHTWDVILNRAYDTDVAMIDQSLAYVFQHYAVDAARLAIGGFSDGASYALSLGLANGKLFTHVIAFSPGFIAPLLPRGRPRVFVSHGAQDQVLPIDACSRRIVPQLQQTGYEVFYREFDGPHTIPDEVAREAVDWFLRTD